MSDFKKMTLADLQYLINKLKTYTDEQVPTDIILYTAQTLSEAQKTQARSNIGAGSLTEDDVNTLIDTKLGVIENASY